ncbi:MAG: MoaD/ThiS family protein [Sporichthya sp.]|nr:MoaD/ThiS family protein [Sporichthya sp.]
MRVQLPAHLKALAKVSGEVRLDVLLPVTQAGVLDAIESRFPELRGRIRDVKTGKRRPLVRFFACEEDLSHDPPESELPPEVVAGTEPYLIVGAMSGG